MTRTSSIIIAQAFYHYWRNESESVNECHEQLLEIPDLHPVNLLWSSCLIGDVAGGMEYFASSVESESRAYIDLGNLRANARCKLPVPIINELEQHPVFLKILKNEGIDANWQQELVERLNAISDVTGIDVRPDRAD